MSVTEPLGLTDAETATLAALVRVVVPDGPGPGAVETALVPRLCQLIAQSAERQAAYRSGLAAFDRVAHRAGARRFIDLPAVSRLDVIRAVDRAVLRTRWVREAPAAARIARRLWRRYYTTPGFGARRGMGEARVFFPRVVDDVMGLFYSSPATWAWLRYDGPPMSDGYSDLLRPRGDEA